MNRRNRSPLNALHLPVVLLSGLLLAQMAAAQTNAPGVTPSGPVSPSVDTGNSPRPSITVPALSPADRTFLEDAMQGYLTSLQGSQMALKKTSNTGVRNFAQHIVDENEKARQKLSTLAQTVGMTMPTAPSLAQRARLMVLSVRDGAGFDKQYVDAIGVDAHEAAVDLFRRATAEASNSDVKALAKDLLPDLQHELDLAKSLQSSLTQVSANN